MNFAQLGHEPSKQKDLKFNGRYRASLFIGWSLTHTHILEKDFPADAFIESNNTLKEPQSGLGYPHRVSWLAVNEL